MVVSVFAARFWSRNCHSGAMRIALFLDNRRFRALGSLPRPSLGNPGIGGTEYEFLVLAELLLGSGLDL